MSCQEKYKLLNNIIASNNVHYNEIKIWEKIKQNSLTMEDGLAKDGAIKELDNQIEACKNEDIFKFINDDTINNVISIICDSWLKHEDEYYSKIFQSIMNSTFFVEDNVLSSIASFNPYEIIGYEIIMQILRTQIMIYKLKLGRFVQNKKDKNNKISNLKRSLKIANSHNNTNLEFELSLMIEQIDDEDYITQEVIFKSCFFTIHKLLSNHDLYFNGVKPLAKETYAKDIANTILNDFFNVEKKYKPSKNTGKKEFYEHNEQEPRIFYYYLSK